MNHKNRLPVVFTVDDIGSDEWKAAESKVENYGSDEMRKNHEKFHDYYSKHPAQKKELYYYIPMSYMLQFMGPNSRDTPFENIRTVGIYTKRDTLCDRHEPGIEIRVNLSCCSEYPGANTFVEFWGHVSGFNPSYKEFRVSFWRPITSDDAEAIHNRFQHIQMRYY